MGQTPLGIQYNPSNDDIYVVNRDSDTVSVIDSTTNTVIDTINVGQNPQDLEFNSGNNNMYVTDLSSNAVSVISTTVSSQPEILKSIQHLINNITKNPLDVTNSIDSANEIMDILTDNNRDNDQIVCDLIDSEDEYISNIREILNC